MNALMAGNAFAASLGLWTLAWAGVVGSVALRLGKPGAAATDGPSGRSQAAEPADTSSTTHTQRIHIIRPCAGAELGLEQRLCSITEARGLEGFDVVVSFTTGRAGDAAAPVIETVIRQLRGFHFDLRPGDISGSIQFRSRHYDLEGARVPVINQKVGQLARASTEVEAEVVINIDSDVDLRGFDFGPLAKGLLRSADEGLSRATVGAQWIAPVEVAPTTGADRSSASVLDSSLHAFGLLGVLDPGTLVGKVFAVRSDALAAVGGFAALGDWLGEDMELARRLRSCGYEVGMAPGVARAMPSGRTREQVVSRYARWMAVIRWQRPHLLLSYPVLFFPALLLLPAWAALFAFASAFTSAGADGALATMAVLGVVATLLVRFGVAAAARRSSGRTASGASLLAGLDADWLIARAWMRCLQSATISWRGRSFRQGQDGKMVLVDAGSGV